MRQLFEKTDPINVSGKESADPKKNADEVIDGKKYKLIGNPPQKIYYEEYGDPTKEPVLFLHGGPGYGTSPFYAQYFNPKDYHIILFDQRNAGRSLPNATVSGTMAHNTPQAMMDDISLLADSFGFDKFHLAGGSWGAYLGPLYAAHHPERLLSLTARALTMGKLSQLNKVFGLDANGEPAMKAETEKSGRWVVDGGAAKGVDDPSCKIDWDRYYNFALEHEPALAKTDPVAAYQKLLNEPTPLALRQQAATEWLLTEFVTGDLVHTRTEAMAYLASMTDERRLSFAMIENGWLHGIKEDLPGFYAQKDNADFNWFFDGVVEKDGKKLKPMEQIAKVPIIRIVHGKQDNICPPEDTDEFEKRLRPLMQRIHGTPQKLNDALKIIRPENTGHMGDEPGIIDGLVQSSTEIAEIRARTTRVNPAGKDALPDH